MKKIKFLTVIFIAVTVTSQTFAQVAGDYRTKSSGNWKTTSVWEEFNGASWVNATSYPNNSTSDVTIRSGHTVVYNNNRTKVKNLNVESNAKLYKNSPSGPFSIQVYGNITCDGMIGNGVNKDAICLSAEGSSCIIAGTGNCKFHYIEKKTNNNTVTDLEIMMNIETYATNGNAITNSSGANTTLRVFIHPDVNVTSNTKIDLGNCEITIKADQAGNCGSLICPDIEKSTVLNTVVERYIQQDMWHYVSSPVDDPNTFTFNNMYLIWFNEPDSAWTYIINNDSLLTTDMQGYALWAASWLTGSKTIEFKGELNSGSRDIDLTYTAAAPHNSKGFNLVGNPYPSAINWNIDGGWSKTNVNSSIYLWNPLLGNYGVYVEDAPFGTNNVDSIIPAHQGFFVECNYATGNLGVNFIAQAHDGSEFFKTSEAFGEDNFLFTVKGSAEYSDQMVIRFSEEATAGFDTEFDAHKLFGLSAAPQLYSVGRYGDYLSVNAMDYSNCSAVPVRFESETPGLYTFSLSAAQGSNGPWQDPVVLEDLKTGILQNLTLNPDYSFNAEIGDNPGRFLLHYIFISNQHFKDAAIASENDEIKVYSFDNRIYLKASEEFSGEIALYNAMGQQILGKELNNTVFETIEVDSGPGYYFVTVRTDDRSFSRKVFLD
ncbi:MAG: T9SS type A sorting domain-containing protein [Bacteroidales bacterium]|nr:T9SS type A sorting domain-containing protein [Bacteroidales bacterium]